MWTKIFEGTLKIARVIPIFLSEKNLSKFRRKILKYFSNLKCKIIFMSNPANFMLGWGWVDLWLNWGFDNFTKLFEIIILFFQSKNLMDTSLL